MDKQSLLLSSHSYDWNDGEVLERAKRDCVMIVPATNAPWVNQVSANIVDLIEISKPFQTTQFTVLNQSGKRVPKKYPHAMIAVKLCFETLPDTLSFLHI